MMRPKPPVEERPANVVEGIRQLILLTVHDRAKTPSRLTPSTDSGAGKLEPSAT